MCNVRLPLVYYLFPVPIFSKTEPGGRWLLIIYYANESMQSVVYIRFNNFQIHFTITVMLKITFLQRIANAGGFWLNDQFWCGPSKLMQAVTGNKYYTIDGFRYSKSKEQWYHIAKYVAIVYKRNNLL